MWIDIVVIGFLFVIFFFIKRERANRGIPQTKLYRDGKIYRIKVIEKTESVLRFLAYSYHWISKPLTEFVFDSPVFYEVPMKAVQFDNRPGESINKVNTMMASHDKSYNILVYVDRHYRDNPYPGKPLS